MTSIAIDNMDAFRDFEAACDDILSVGPMELSVGSLELDLDFAEWVDQEDVMLSSLQSPPAPSPAHTKHQQSPSTMQMKKQPRMVSMESMTHMRAELSSPTKKSSSSTPYDSLKMLVKNKQLQKATLTKRPAEHDVQVAFITGAPSMIVDDTDELPFTSLRALLAAEEPAPKRRKTDTGRLHRACSQTNLTLESVQDIFREDSQAVSRRVSVSTEKSVYSHTSFSMVTKSVRETYTFPLNMAINNNASAAVVEALVNADPSILTERDGLQQEGSLHVLLKHHQVDTAVLDALLLANPFAVKMLDRHSNTPLHVASRAGASLDTVRHLCVMYPDAVLMRNFHGRTPLDLARSNIHMCSDEVANYLWVRVHNMAL